MEYKYDAFISYRHCELDKFVAENLHKQLEAFKLPKNIAKKEDLKRKKIERVFRDRDELPLASNLEDPIVEALTFSEFLIVICSPRLKESMWCTKEIQTFIEMHGRHKVLAVLIEGEPEDSFPQELLVDDKGNPVEPLAADVRGKNNAEVKKAIKAEMLRLLAPMFGLGYDDLKQRHREQQLKRTAGIVSLCGAVGIAFGVVCATSAVRINAQKKQIEKQNIILAESQAESLSKEALELYKNDNRHDSVELAYKAMTEYEGVKMPRSAYSESVLAECMSVYDGANVGKSALSIKTPGILKDMKVSPSGQFVMTVDNMGNLIVWDIKERESHISLKEECDVSVFDFIDEDTFFYITTKGGLQIGDISSKQVKRESDGDDLFFDIVWDAKTLPDKKHMALLKVNKIDVYDIDTLKVTASYKCETGEAIDEMFVSPDGKIFGAGINVKEEPVCIAIDSKTGEKLSECSIAKGNVYDVCIGKNTAYILSAEAIFDNGRNESFITAVDLNTCDKKYETSTVGMVGLNCYVSNAGGKDNVLIESFSEMRLFEGQTGEVLQYYFKDASTAKVMTAEDGDFLVYDENGNCRCLDVSDDLTDLEIPTIASSNVVQLETSAFGMVGRRKNDDRLIIYTYLINKDSYEYNDELKEPKDEGYTLDGAVAWANENDIDDANFVNSAVTIEELNLILVGYIDNTLRVYDANTKELIQKYDEFTGVSLKYYGKVADYYLVGDYGSAFLFDKDGGIRAKIDALQGLSKDGKAIVISGRNMDAEKCDIAIPVYTQDALLKKTKEYLDR